MAQVFDAAGKLLGVTVIQVGPNVVSQVKTVATDGYDAIQLQLGKKKREFRVEKPADYKVGQELKVDGYKVGEMLNVSGLTIGKGFAGVVKRFHKHRGPMSHGSKSHRIPGSSGAGTTPGRVYRGRKMPGRLGGGRVTEKRLEVIQVIAEKNLLLLKGPVPGKPGNLILITKE